MSKRNKHWLVAIAVVAATSLVFWMSCAEGEERRGPAKPAAFARLDAELAHMSHRLTHARRLRDAANTYASAIEAEIKSARELHKLMHQFPICDDD